MIQNPKAEYKYSKEHAEDQLGLVTRSQTHFFIFTVLY